MTNHFVLDFETTDTRPSAGIFEAALVLIPDSVVFFHNNIENPAAATESVDVAAWVDQNHTKPDRLTPWGEQWYTARAATQKISLRDLVDKIVQTVTVKDSYIWARGYDFESKILNYWCEHYVLDKIPYNVWRDVRTISDLFPHDKTPHNALDDVLIEAQAVREFINACSNSV